MQDSVPAGREVKACQPLGYAETIHIPLLCTSDKWSNSQHLASKQQLLAMPSSCLQFNTVRGKGAFLPSYGQPQVLCILKTMSSALKYNANYLLRKTELTFYFILRCHSTVSNLSIPFQKKEIICQNEQKGIFFYVSKFLYRL